MRVAVTGAHGQLVQSLVEKASGRSNIEIVTLGRPQVDLERPRSLANAIAAAMPDVVINAAAYTAVDEAEDEPQRAFRVNADAAGEAALAAAAAGALTIQISTDYVFDGLGGGAYPEDALTGPRTVYGRSKLAGEEQVRDATPNHLIVRTAWVYSPFGRNFVKTMFEAAEQHDTLRVVADQRGSPTSAFDLADGLLTLIDHWRGGGRNGQGQTYHLAGSGDASWHELAEEVMDVRAQLDLRTATIEPVTSNQWPTRAQRPRNSVLDSSKFERDFNFRMPGWRQSVAEVVNRLAPDR